MRDYKDYKAEDGTSDFRAAAACFVVVVWIFIALMGWAGEHHAAQLTQCQEVKNGKT